MLPLQKAEWEREVTEASKESWVIVALTSSEGGNVESRVLSEVSFLPTSLAERPEPQPHFPTMHDEGVAAAIVPVLELYAQ